MFEGGEGGMILRDIFMVDWVLVVRVLILIDMRLVVFVFIMGEGLVFLECFFCFEGGGEWVFVCSGEILKELLEMWVILRLLWVLGGSFFFWDGGVFELLFMEFIEMCVIFRGFFGVVVWFCFCELSVIGLFVLVLFEICMILMGLFGVEVGVDVIFFFWLVIFVGFFLIKLFVMCVIFKVLLDVGDGVFFCDEGVFGFFVIGLFEMCVIFGVLFDVGMIGFCFVLLCLDDMGINFCLWLIGGGEDGIVGSGMCFGCDDGILIGFWRGEDGMLICDLDWDGFWLYVCIVELGIVL